MSIAISSPEANVKVITSFYVISSILKFYKWVSNKDSVLRKSKKLVVIPKIGQ